MTQSSPTFVSALATSAFLIAGLAACGGGGGGSVVTDGDGDGPPEITMALQQAATAAPATGRRSITQSSNADSNNLTTDTVSAVFDRGQLTVQITGDDGSEFELNSADHTLERFAGTPLRQDQDAYELQLHANVSDGDIIARVFGEIASTEFPLRSIHVGGNWGTNPVTTMDWESSGRSQPLIPPDYIDYISALNVNWTGLTVALHYDDSMDSTVDRVYSPDVDVPTFSDDAIRQYIREFRQAGLDVYLTLAFESHEAETAARPVHRWQLGDPGQAETGVPPDDPALYGTILPESWPWRPDHPDHQRFVAEFWDTYTEQAVHFARIAEQEGVRLFSLGTEIERLFRTRPGGYWPNDFAAELRTMVDRVRQVYSGLLTYDMHYSALTASDYFGPGSNHLWEDLGLDVVGISAWFPLADTEPTAVMSVEELQARYEEIFQEYLIPLAQISLDRPIVFLEYGATDNVGSPFNPAGQPTHFDQYSFSDENGNGIDDGRETQANIFQALLNTMAEHPGILNGVFWWDNYVATDRRWDEINHRGFPLRNKPVEDIVRFTYESWGDWLVGGYWMHVTEDKEVAAVGAFVDAPELVGTPTLPVQGTAEYEGFSLGAYAIEYGTGDAQVDSNSHELGEYEGSVELTADFGSALISGRIHSLRTNGFDSQFESASRPFSGGTMPYELILDAADFDSGGFTGEVTVTSTDPAVDITSTNGSWGGDFSVVPDSDGNPRLVAGTHGAAFTTTDDTQASFVGVFAGSTQQ